MLTTCMVLMPTAMMLKPLGNIIHGIPKKKNKASNLHLHITEITDTSSKVCWTGDHKPNSNFLLQYKQVYKGDTQTGSM